MHNTVGCICFHDMYVRNLLQWKATWMVIYAFIVGSVHFHVQEIIQDTA